MITIIFLRFRFCFTLLFDVEARNSEYSYCFCYCLSLQLLFLQNFGTSISVFIKIKYFLKLPLCSLLAEIKSDLEILKARISSPFNAFMSNFCENPTLINP